MAILFKKTIKGQSGLVTTPVQRPADYWRNQMSTTYDKHLNYMRANQGAMDRTSPYYKDISANPLYIERQGMDKGVDTTGKPIKGGWEYDAQSFRPGYFTKHYGPGYYERSMPEGADLEPMYQQYNKPIPGAVTKPRI